MNKLQWVNGDEVVARYLYEHIPARLKPWMQDQSLLGMLVQDVSIRAHALLTCAHRSCRQCARAVSGFSENIINARVANVGPQCKTFNSWRSPVQHRVCH